MPYTYDTSTAAALALSMWKKQYVEAIRLLMCAL